MNIYSVLQNFNKNKHYFKEPYPHIIIERCLPLKTYELLYENFPVQTIKDNFLSIYKIHGEINNLKLPEMDPSTMEGISKEILNKH